MKKGSFQEIINIVFTHPVTLAAIGGAVTGLISHLLPEKKRNSESFDLSTVTNNYGVMNNINFILAPLENENDSLRIEIPDSEPIVLTKNDKALVKTGVENIKRSETKEIELVEEDFFGNLNSVNVRQEKFGFIREGTSKIIPTSFDNEPDLEEIKRILAERLKINARASYEDGELKKIDIVSYEIKYRKTLNEYKK